MAILNGIIKKMTGSAGQQRQRMKWVNKSSLSPNEYIRNRRLKFARELLLDGKHNVTETAYLAGFGTPNDFRDCFRAEYGLSPTDFVNQNRN